MGYTMTFDASHKVKAGDGHAKQFERHLARDADERAGFAFGHSNKNIDPARTHLNESFVNDGTGGFRLVAVTRDDKGEPRPPSAEIGDYLAARLSTVKKPLRKDAVVMRGIVLQLDPKWFDEHNPDWRENGLNDEGRRLTNATLAWASEEFGQANVVGGALHLDEHSPQLQLIVTPVTDDGRLSQKDFFKGPGDLKRQHRSLREHMIAAGYDADLSVSSRSKEHLSSDEFADKAERARSGEALAAQAAETIAQADAERIVDEQAAEVEDFAVEYRSRRLDDRERDLDDKHLALATDRLQTAQERRKAQSAIDAAKAAQIAAHEAQRDAEALSDELADALDGDAGTWSERWADRQGLGDRYREDRAHAETVRHKAKQRVGGTSARDRLIARHKAEKSDDRGMGL